MRITLLLLAAAVFAPETWAQTDTRRDRRARTPSRTQTPRTRTPSRTQTPRTRTPSRSYNVSPRPSRYTPRSRVSNRPTTRARATTRRPTVPGYRRPSTTAPGYQRPTTTAPGYQRPTTWTRTRATTPTTTRRTYVRPGTRAGGTAGTFRGPSGAVRPRDATRATNTTGTTGTTDAANRTRARATTTRRPQTFTTPGSRGDRTRVAPRATTGANRYGYVRSSSGRTYARDSRGRYTRSSVANARYGYRPAERSIAGRRTYARHDGHRRAHTYYRHSGLHLSFSFGLGLYSGCSYYYPYYNYALGRHYAFFYPHRVAYCYAPFGFYYDVSPVYITERVYIREDYANTDYTEAEIDEAAELDEAAAAEKEVEPEPAAGSPTTEKFLREASEAFHKGEYEEAAKKFRLAAIASPDQAGPLFALGQALIALGDDDYAAAVIRKAVERSADLVKEPGDIVGVYKSQKEFDRIIEKLANRAEAGQPGGSARFLLAVQRYFTGDPRARAAFRALAVALPKDETVALFVAAVETRFKAESELPPIK